MVVVVVVGVMIGAVVESVVEVVVKVAVKVVVEEWPPEGVSDPVGDRLVTRAPVPDAEDVLLEPHAHHRPADLLPHHELLPKHRQHKVLPAPAKVQVQEVQVQEVQVRKV